jgi:hypothetical protein
MVPTHLRRTPTGALRAGLDSLLPDPLNVGAGTAIVVTGWCYHEWLSIRELRVQCGDSVAPAVLSGIPRCVSEDESPRAASAGFAAVLPIPGIARPMPQPIIIHAVLAGGRTESATLGSLRLNPSLRVIEEERSLSDSVLSAERMGVKRRPYDAGEDETFVPTVAICLATSDPSTDIFARQVAAFRAQTEANWICLINDDGSKPESLAAIRGMLGDDRRFQLLRQSTKQGAYRSIENCLNLVPSQVDFVALCGPNDIWQRDALAVLRSRFMSRTSLVCTSAISENVSELLISGLSLGTAMFCRTVLDRILPFPPAAADARFDPWIACVAATSGKIARIAEPICEAMPKSGPTDADPLPRLSLRARLSQWLADGPRQFGEHRLRIQQLAQALRKRDSDWFSRAQIQALDRAIDPLWLLIQAGRTWLGRKRATGHASAVLHAQLWSTIVRTQRGIGFGRQRPRPSAVAQRRAA